MPNFLLICVRERNIDWKTGRQTYLPASRPLLNAERKTGRDRQLERTYFLSDYTPRR